MITRIIRLAAILVAVIVLAPAPAQAQNEVNDYEREVVRLINQERARLGRPALGSDIRLWDAAEKHNDWMCRYQRLSHVGSGGSSVSRRISAEGYSWRALGETIAQGYGTPAAVVAGWKGSAPHWNILMNSTYRDIGVAYQACSSRARRHYWNVDVGNSTQAAQPIGGGNGGGGGGSEPTPTTRPTSTSRPPTRPTSVPRPTVTPRPVAPPSGAGSIAGRVSVQGQVSAAGVSIYLDGRLKTTLGADGAFSLGGLSAGRHVVHARKAGWLDSGAVVNVYAGRATQLGVTALRAGDAVVNNRVDYSDFRELVAWWGRCGVSSRADVDGDGCIGYNDYLWLRQNYGRRGPTSWTSR